MNDQYMTTTEAGRVLGYKPETISHYCKAGKLPGAVRFGEHGHWRIPLEALDALGPDTTSVLPPRSARSRGQMSRRAAA